MTNGDQAIKVEFEPAFVPESEIIIPLRKVPAKPEVPPTVLITHPDKKPLILNIETTGLDPFTDRIICVGLQDPIQPLENPFIILLDSEQEMLNALMTVITDGGYNQLVGYGLSFDFRFIFIKAMFYSVPCKEFFNMGLYDLMQAMAQVKMEFVYFPQKAPKLTDVATFFWDYPKPFPDTDMIKYYQSGALDKVLEFASGQITRTLLLYLLYRDISETPHSGASPGIEGMQPPSFGTSTPPTSSMLTIPEALPSKTWHAKCPNDLAEFDVPNDIILFECPIDHTMLRKP